MVVCTAARARRVTYLRGWYASLVSDAQLITHCQLPPPVANSFQLRTTEGGPDLRPQPGIVGGPALEESSRALCAQYVLQAIYWTAVAGPAHEHHCFDHIDGIAGGRAHEACRQTRCKM